MATRPRAADDFATIRENMERIRRERGETQPEDLSWLVPGTVVRIYRGYAIYKERHTVASIELPTFRAKVREGVWRLEKLSHMP